MLRKYFLIPLVLAIAGMLGSVSPAQAQRRGNRGAARGRVAVRTGVYRNSYRGTGYRNRGYANWNRGYGNYYGRGYNTGYRPYWYGGYGGYGGFGYGLGYLNSYPYYSSYYGSSPYYGYGSPYYSYYNSPTYNSSTYTTPYYAGSPYSSGTAIASNVATVDVNVPNPQARVWFDNTLTTQTGTERIFQTAPLTHDGVYHIRATWNAADGHLVTQDKTVTVTPNETTVVNFMSPNY